MRHSMRAHGNHLNQFTRPRYMPRVRGQQSYLLVYSDLTLDQTDVDFMLCLDSFEATIARDRSSVDWERE